MTAPRISPGTPAEIGHINHGLARLIGAATGGPPPHVLTTLARHRGLFRRWLRFAGALMPGGLLPRDQSELMILRVANNCNCEYERVQHVRLGLDAGLSQEEIDAIPFGPAHPGFSDSQRLLLTATDELHGERTITQGTWDRLAAVYSERKLIEICMLVGHYEMLAMTLNALAVEPDVITPGPSPRLLGLAQKLIRRGGAGGRTR